MSMKTRKLKKNDIIIIVLFFLIILSFIITAYEINSFMPVLKTCNDDFAIINKCHCVPCSWKDADNYDGGKCIDSRNLTYG